MRQCEGHTESLLVGSGRSTELVPLEKRKAMLMFAMKQEDSYLCCKCQLTEIGKQRYSKEISNVKLKRLELKMTKSQNNSFELEAFKVFK